MALRQAGLRTVNDSKELAQTEKQLTFLRSLPPSRREAILHEAGPSPTPDEYPRRVKWSPQSYLTVNGMPTYTLLSFLLFLSPGQSALFILLLNLSIVSQHQETNDTPPSTRTVTRQLSIRKRVKIIVNLPTTYVVQETSSKAATEAVPISRTIKLT